METAWSCMWNVTDETPLNCRRFLDGGGMDLFLKCKQMWGERQVRIQQLQTSNFEYFDFAA